MRGSLRRTGGPRAGHRDAGFQGIRADLYHHALGLSVYGTVMPLLVDKILTLFVMPLGMAIGAGLLALAAFALGRHRTAGGLLAFAIVWLWGWSTPLATRTLVAPLADPYPAQRVETLPAADAVVLLGGGIGPIQGNMIYPDLKGSTDRIWHAARLYHAGKAPLIIASSGNVWGRRKQQSKADAMRMLLSALGVPDDAILIEGSSRNTRQNAVFTEKLAADRGISQVLLVTSYWHLRRAEAAFKRVGLDVIPAATDHTNTSSARARLEKPLVFSFLPTVGTLSTNSRFIREHLGYLVYRLRGWV